MKKRTMVTMTMLMCLYDASYIYGFDIKSMFTAMGTTFGAPPVGYTYSFEVWNDASVPMYVEFQGIASFMGAFFPSAKGYYGQQTMPSIFDAAGSVSKAECYNKDYYFKLSIGTSANAHANAVYRQNLTQLPLKKKDPNVYYYHIFTSGGYNKGSSFHEPIVEMMGYQNPEELTDPNSKKKGNVVLSSQLSTLAFCNSSGVDTQVSLKYGQDTYTFTLEKYSYNKLAVPTAMAPAPSVTSNIAIKSTDAVATAPQVAASEKSVNKQNVTIQAVSDAASSADTSPDAEDKTPAQPPLFSLRPNTLSFASVASASNKATPFKSFQLPSQGFDGYTYTIEVFQDPGQPLNVGIQGLMTGNYDIGTTARIRDLTPCPCTFWYQSFEQAGSVQGYSNLPGQIWVAYAGGDEAMQAKVTPGKALSWNLVRPLLKQGDQLLYFIYVATTDDAVAEKFVTKLMKQTIGKNVINQFQQAIQAPIVFSNSKEGLDLSGDEGEDAQLSLTSEQEVATLMGNLGGVNGSIEDTEQNVVGYIVGTDVFTPCGFGFGRFYYTLPPAVLSVGNIVSLLYAYLDSAKTAALGSSLTDIQTSMQATVTGWLATYIKKPADAQQQVQQYLLTYGNTNVVSADGNSLTKFGQACLQQIVSGKVSLKYPSLKLSTVTNHYVYDFGQAAPENMPTPVVYSRATA